MPWLQALELLGLRRACPYERIAETQLKSCRM
jgi:hypothetical protein